MVDGMLSEAIREAVKMRRRRFWIDEDDMSIGISPQDGNGVAHYSAYDRKLRATEVEVVELKEGDILLTREEVERVAEELSYLYGAWEAINMFTKNNPRRKETEEALDLLNAKRGGDGPIPEATLSGSEEKR